MTDSYHAQWLYVVFAGAVDPAERIIRPDVSHCVGIGPGYIWQASKGESIGVFGSHAAYRRHRPWRRHLGSSL